MVVEGTSEKWRKNYDQGKNSMLFREGYTNNYYHQGKNSMLFREGYTNFY